MEDDRNLAIVEIKARIAMRENEKKRLKAVIGDKTSPERRAQAFGDLRTLLRELRADVGILENLEGERRG